MVETATRAQDAAWVSDVRAQAVGIRKRVLEHVLRQGEGYLSQACSSAELLATLYGHILRLLPTDEPGLPGKFVGVPGHIDEAVEGWRRHGVRDPGCDRFIVSPAQYALPLYAALIEAGRLSPEALESYNQDGGTLEMIGAEHSPGFEVTSGSLAQGASQALGIALARRLNGDTGRVVVLISDGELEEGQTWEMLATGAFLHVDSLYVVVDSNGQQCDGRVADVTQSEPLLDRFKAFGASVSEIDGHDPVALVDAFENPPAPQQGAPHVVIARTDPIRGVPLLAERAPRLHTVRLKTDAERREYQQFYDKEYA